VFEWIFHNFMRM